jgi:O-antigen ligase
VFFAAATLSITQAADRGLTAAGLIRWLTVFAMYFLIIGLVRDREMLRLSLLTLVISGVFDTAAGLSEMLLNREVVPAQLEVGQSMTLNGTRRIHGLSPDCDKHAACLMILSGLLQYFVFFAKSWRQRLLFGGLLLLLLMNIVGTGSRAGWIGAGVSLATFFLFVELRHKLLYSTLAVAAVPCVFLVLIVAFPDVAVLERFQSSDEGGTGSASLTFRKEMLRVCLEMGIHNPLFGVGTGNFLTVYPRYSRISEYLSKEHPLIPHNIFAAVWAENGVIGFVLYLAMALCITWQAFRVMRGAPDQDLRMLALGVFAALMAFEYGQNMYALQGHKYGWAVMGFAAALGSILRREQGDAPAERIPLYAFTDGI